jgi:hypothetical protein
VLRLPAQEETFWGASFGTFMNGSAQTGDDEVA